DRVPKANRKVSFCARSFMTSERGDHCDGSMRRNVNGGLPTGGFTVTPGELACSGHPLSLSAARLPSPEKTFSKRFILQHNQSIVLAQLRVMSRGKKKRKKQRVVK